VAVKEILLFPKDEEKLRKKSKKVKKIDTNVQKLIRDLKETLLANPGAGLASPQIGVHKRVVVVRFGQDTGEMEAPRALINPVILEEGPLEKGFDGCLSLPRISTWDTSRPSWLRFRAQDEEGKPFEMRVEGIDSILVHHEIDHLDGILFLDRLPEDGQLYIAVETEDGTKLVPLEP
jgi:peptide deformylase